MKRKHIDRARETRLWIVEVIVPGIMLVSTAMQVPEFRQAVVTKYAKAKIKVNNFVMNVKNKINEKTKK